MKKRKSKISTKIFLISLIPFLLTTITVNTAWIFINRKTSHSLIENAQLEISQITTERLSEKMEQILWETGQISNKEDWFSNPKDSEINAKLNEYASNYNRIYNYGLSIYNPTGTLIRTTIPDFEIMKQIPPELKEKILQSGEGFFSNLIYDPVIKQYIIMIFQPVYNKADLAGFFSGVLIAKTSLIETYYQKSMEFSYKKIGYAMIYDGNQKIIHHRKFGNQGKPVSSYLPEFKNQQISSEPQFMRTLDDSGEPVICGYAKIKFSDWTLIAVERINIIFEPARKYMTMISIGSFILIIIITLLILFGSRQIIIPINNLKKGAAKLAKGDFNINIETRTKDELSDLAQTFNVMALELKNYYTSLEKTVQDRTAELKITNKQLILAREKAEQASKAKSIFLANMSHEIRTPMNAILGFSEILRAKVTDSKHLQYINSIHSSGQNLLNIINDILDISKVEAGKIEIKKSPESIHTIFEELKNLYKPKFDEKNVNFLTEIAPEIPELVLLDKNRIMQIMINLLNNSWKFTEKGYVKISAEVLFRSRKSYSSLNLYLKVEDTGIGIPKDKQEDIFSPFHQLDHDHNVTHGGTGLGLSITKGLIELMDGNISVESTPGEGTIFTIEIKRVEVPLLTNKTTEEPENIPKIQFDRNTIIVADDIIYNRKLITTYLEDFNLDIIEAKNGFETLALTEKYKPALILLDIKMPVLNGFEVVKQLKEKKETKNIPVIAVTASALPEQQKEILKHCNAILNKPLALSDLIRELQKYLPYKRLK